MANKRQYCYPLINEKKLGIDEDKLVNHIEELYYKNIQGLEASRGNKTPPILVVYHSNTSEICVTIKTNKKQVVENISTFHNEFKPKKYVKNIYINPPYQFTTKTEYKSKQELDSGVYWNTLTHNGPYFSDIVEKYEPLKAPLIYNGKEYLLTPIEEKVAVFYAKRIISEQSGNIGKDSQYINNTDFNNNFFNDFKQYLTAEHLKVFKDFKKIVWSKLVDSVKSQQEQKKNSSKLQDKIKAEKIEKQHGYAILDGNREKIGNYKVEPQGIFFGRGDNPKKGKIKGVIRPEDVTINIGKEETPPVPPKGHSWKAVVSDNTARWLSKWTDTITNDIKYVYFNQEGRFKGESDKAKYDNARKINKYYHVIEKQFMDHARSNNKINKELGTVLYLIANFGFRVGNEKDDDQAETLGATTLNVENVTILPNSQVKFHFIAKDSILYDKTLVVDPIIYKNFRILTTGANKKRQLFENVTSDTVNKYLKTFDKDFYSKVFRTRLASNTMHNLLAKVTVPEKTTKAEVKKVFNAENAQVAKILNHTRNQSVKAVESINKQKQELATELEKPDKSDKKIKRLETSIANKEQTADVAVGTSLSNYIDPRIVFSWCSKNNLEPKAIYTTTMVKKFNWATSTPPDWDWEKTDIDDVILNSQLNIDNLNIQELQDISNACNCFPKNKKPIDTLSTKLKKLMYDYALKSKDKTPILDYVISSFKQV